MKTRNWLIALLALALLASACATPPAAPTEVEQPVETAAPVVPTNTPEKKVVVGMMTIVSHPSLDAIQQGVKDKLKEAGYVEGQNLTLLEGNAEGDMATLSTIAQKYVDENVDVIVATTTPALQAAYNATKDAAKPPIIWNGVSNPYIAGVADSPDKHPAWMLGTQLLDPVEETMKLLHELLPDVKAVGILYNPAEANAVYLVDLAKEVAGELGMTMETAPVSNSSEVQTAAEALAGRDIDALLAVGDNTVTSAFEPLVQVANDNDLPLIGTSASMPPMGAALSYGVNPYQEGLDSGEMVVQFLKGELDLATTPIPVQTSVLLTVNPKAAEAQGFSIPQALVDKADKIVE
jgi:putative ABC transport system substrate-binding protein